MTAREHWYATTCDVCEADISVCADRDDDGQTVAGLEVCEDCLIDHPVVCEHCLEPVEIEEDLAPASWDASRRVCRECEEGTEVTA